jgi:hypothetical protein
MRQSHSSFDELCAKKAFEIAYAVFRLSDGISSRSFADSFERQGIQLLEAATGGDHERILRQLASLEYFLRLGREANFISRQHGELLYQEMAAFRSAVADFDHTSRITDPAWSEIFTRVDWPVSPKPDTNPAEARQDIHSGIRSNLAENKVSFSGRQEAVPAKRQEDERNRVEERQKRILGVIRQYGTLPEGKGNCRLKDIQEVLTDASERTIRYDIQELIARGEIERIGNGGPATFYRLPEQGVSAAARRAPEAGKDLAFLPSGLPMSDGANGA